MTIPYHTISVYIYINIPSQYANLANLGTTFLHFLGWQSSRQSRALSSCSLGNRFSRVWEVSRRGPGQYSMRQGTSLLKSILSIQYLYTIIGLHMYMHIATD